MLKRLRTVTCITVLVVLVAGAIFGGSWLSWWARTLVGAVALLALLRVILSAKFDPPSAELGKPPAIPPTNHEIAQAYFNAVTTYQKRSLGLLVKMLIDLPNYLERINENAVFEEEIPQLAVSTTQVYRVGVLIEARAKEQKLCQSLLIPLLFVQKGRLLDGFCVYAADGHELPTLSYTQTRGLLAYAIRVIVENTPKSSNGMDASEREAMVKSIVAKLTEAVCSPGPLEKQEPSEQARIRDLLDSASQLPVEGDWKERIRTFCERLVDYYVIIAEATPPNGAHLQIMYQQRIPVESSSLRLANRWRSRFGLRFAIIDIPLHLFALRAEAYHLQMNAAPMQYVYDHHLEWLTSERRVTQSDLSDGEVKPYVRLHYNSAEPAMHLYIRRQPANEAVGQGRRSTSVSANESGAWPDRLKSVVEFREIPPGALGAAAAISLMTSVLICFFALTRIGQAQSTNTVVTVASDIPALLIALPGIASLIVGAWLDLSHLRRASLTTYWGLGASMALSFSSALYFLLDAYKTIPDRVTLTIANNVNVRSDIGWLVLATLSVSCTLFLARDVFSSSRYYFRSVKGRIARRTP
jgi:hypothetical protein